MPSSDRVKGWRFSNDSNAVSEIIGDILLVSIAVVMVGTLAVQIGSVEPPKEKSMASLGTAYDGTNITVTHLGGDPLLDVYTRFYVLSNDNLMGSYNVSDGRGGATRLDIGQNWTVTYPSDPSERVRLQIIDTRGQLIILDRILQRGPALSALPDVGLASGDIAILKNGMPVDEENNTPMTKETIVFNTTIHNYGGSGVSGVQVRLSDYSSLDRRTYEVANRTIPFLDAFGSVNLSVDYIIQNGSWGLHSVAVKIVPLFNETHYANNYASKGYRVGYPVMASSPNRPFLTVRSIDFSDDHPVHGTTIMLSARISNQGGVSAYATVRYYDDSKSSLIATDSGLGIPVGGETYSTVFWKTSSSGLHSIIVNVTDPNGTGDERRQRIEILPTMLLVDDDRSAAGGLRDVVTPMEAALQSVGASYTLHGVSGGDGPAYDTGTHPMKDFDLVIWLTGYENTTTLTVNDKNNLYRYLFDSHGKLWLAGQDVVTDLGYSDLFLHRIFGLDTATPPAWMDAGTPDPLAGADAFAGAKFGFGPFPPGLDNRGDYIQNTTRSAVGFMEPVSPGRPVGLLFNATTNGTPATPTYMASLFSFELSRVGSNNDRSLIVYSMLEWFNCTAQWGRDLAISDQSFNLTAPSFMEKVNITVFVRNNGESDEPQDFMTPILHIGFYVDGRPFSPVSAAVDSYGNLSLFNPSLSEIWVPQSTTDPALAIRGRGGYIKVSMVWTADSVGNHNISVMVDPYDYIDEVNEYNNRVSSSVNNGSLFVRYGTLVVDDDQSANNGGALYNATSNLTGALDALLYHYDTFVVAGAAADGPDQAILDKYNAVIWAAGESAGALTANDTAFLESFLKKSDGRYLWFIGQDAVPDGNYWAGGGAGGFVRDYLRVARVADPAAPKTPSRMSGVNFDPVSHGMLYPATPAFADGGGLLVPYIDGRGMFIQSPMPDMNTYNRIVYGNPADGTIASWYERMHPIGTVNTVTNVEDAALGARAVSLSRTGANVQDSVFMLGDFSASDDQNPSDLPWGERDRLTAQWTFSTAVNYTFGWHLTDTANLHHTLFYDGGDSDSTGVPNPTFGLGSWTREGLWHTATRDLLLDLRDGTGDGLLQIRSVDGFEMRINEGEGRLGEIVLTRPFNSVRYENSTYNFKTVFTAWDPSFVSYTGNSNYSSELAYMVMRWFNLYDARTELRVTYQDLYFGNLTPVREMRPTIGESYVLKAMVWNPGGTRGDAVVRFLDGTTVIDTVTLSVGASSRALAEIVWTPLFAGSRSIGVTVDPDNTMPEVLRFNNLAAITIECCFFYDDLEGGTRNWDHYDVILRTNGEVPLEYMDKGAVQTGIIGQWGEMNGWYNSTDNRTLTNLTSVYHSWPTSFYMHESKQDARRPVDCVVVLDRSGSMAGEPLQDCKNAANYFITRLESVDRISIWSFSDTVTMNQGFTFNKTACINAVKGLSSGGFTAGWPAMNMSVTYCIQNSRPEALRVVVFLTDGEFNVGSVGGITYTKASTLARISTMNGPLFTIGLGDSVNAQDLIDAAAASQNGAYYEAPTSAELQTIYAQIAQAIQQLVQAMGRSVPEGGAGGRTPVDAFADGFESAAPAWTVVNTSGAGSTWTRTTSVRHSGNYGYRCYSTVSGQYVNGDDDTLTSPAFDLTGLYSPRLSFWFRPNIRNNEENCRVYVSNDSGANWNLIWSWNDYNTLWIFEPYLDLTCGGTLNMTANMMVRFRFTSSAFNTYPGWTVDDVAVFYDPSLSTPPVYRYWMNGDEDLRDRSLTTPTFSLQGASGAKLGFWQKYDIKTGSNGGVLQVGTAATAAGPFNYTYVTPTQPYPGNLQISQWGSARLKDSYGHDMRWCWNGISASGTFGWERVEVDLSAFCGNQYVRIRFLYLYCSGGTGLGWAIDDVEVRVNRADSVALTTSAMDQWELVTKGGPLSGTDTADAYGGSHAWLCHDPAAGVDYLKGGLDNSLVTVPIDLTNALDAALDFRVKFNINGSEGRPPDGFRVEVSSDNGLNWQALNRGVRSGSFVSGSQAAGADGTSITGVELGDHWVASRTLSRLNCDLSGWAGSVILLRFRVVTRTDIATHYESGATGFGGIYIDDIKIVGNTTTGGRAAPRVAHAASQDGRPGTVAEGGGAGSPAATVLDINNDDVDASSAADPPAGSPGGGMPVVDTARCAAVPAPRPRQACEARGGGLQ